MLVTNSIEPCWRFLFTCLLIIIIGCTHKVYAQDINYSSKRAIAKKLKERQLITDSIKNILNNKSLSDFEKSVLFDYLSDQYFLLDDVQALQYAFKSLEFARQSEHIPYQIQALYNIASIYLSHDLIDESRASLKEIAELCQQTDNKLDLEGVYHYMALSYYSQNDYKMALHYDTLSLNTLIEAKADTVRLKGVKKILGIYIDISRDYLSLQKPEEAYAYILKAEQEGVAAHKEVLDSIQWIVYHPKYLLGWYCLQTHDYQKATIILKEVYQEALQDENWSMVSEASLRLSEIFELQKNFKEAFIYQTIYKSTLDTINAQKKNKELVTLNISEQVSLKNEQIHQLQRIQYYQIGLGGSILFILTSIILFLYLRHQKFKKTNTILKNQKKEITTNNEQLTETHEKINTLHQRLEELVQQRTAELEKRNQQLIEYGFINSHRLRSPISRIQGILQVLEIIINSPSGGDKEYKDLLNMLIYTAQELDELTDNIYLLIEQKESFNRDDLDKKS